MLNQIVISLIGAPSDILHGDISGDGVPEILAVHTLEQPNSPSKIRVDVYQYSNETFQLLKQVHLSNRAILWDIENGWWGLDSRGVVDLWNDQVIVEAYSWLRQLGPTTPVSADIATDLNGDGVAEIIWPEPGQWRIVSSDGTDWGSIPSQVSGELRSRSEAGGTRFDVTHQSKSIAIGNVDGLHSQDILMIQNDEALVSYMQDGRVIQSQLLKLPIETQEKKEDGPGKSLSNVWYRDINGDNQIDMAWQYWVTKDSWFGATAELGVSYSDGSNFSSPHSQMTEQAVVDVKWVDWDNDGNEDFTLLGVDLGMATLARALLSKEVKLSLSIQPIRNDGFGPLNRIWEFTVPIDGPEDFEYDLSYDWTGDALPDLLILQGGKLSIFESDGTQIQSDATMEIDAFEDTEMSILTLNDTQRILSWSPSNKSLHLTWRN